MTTRVSPGLFTAAHTNQKMEKTTGAPPASFGASLSVRLAVSHAIYGDVTVVSGLGLFNTVSKPCDGA